MTLSVESSAEARLHRQLRQQQALAHLSQLFLEGTELTSLMQKAAEHLSEILEVEVVGILERIGEGRLVIRAAVGMPETVPGETAIPLVATTPAGYALATDQTVYVDHLPADTRFSRPLIIGDLGMVSGMSVSIPARSHRYGVLGAWTRTPRPFTEDEGNFLKAVANLLGGAVSRTVAEDRLAEALEANNRSLRYETALARCAHALLSAPGDAALETAMRALLEVTQASYGWVQRNLDEAAETSEPALRISIEGDLPPALERYPHRVHWSALPTLRDRLAAGKTVTVSIDDLPPSEREVFLASPVPIRSEIDLPILVDGRWVATAGFSYGLEDQTWDPGGLTMLETAASMISSWWGQQEADHALIEALEARNRSLRLERALAQSAQALGSGSPNGLGTAICALLNASDATSVFVERNVEDHQAGLCSHVIESVRRDGAGYEPTYWDMMPWSRMPTSYEALSTGREVVLIVGELDGPEGETYRASPIKSEIDVPINIDGEWVGLIGFADERVERSWDDERELLRTAAELIGAAWAREQARVQLEQLVRSKDEFVASISHELRTPLTAVLGLAESLVEQRDSLTPAEAGEFIALIAEQTTEVTDIVSDLLVAARADIGKVTIALEPVQLRSAILGALRTIPAAGRVEVIGDGSAFADSLRVRQILRNLFTNASRYGGKRVQVVVSSAAGRARIQVRDNGDGIEPEDRERVFLPYQRAHRRVGQPGSVGLGLSVSRQLAELMGGSLTYDHLDGWSTFTLELPSS